MVPMATPLVYVKNSPEKEKQLSVSTSSAKRSKGSVSEWRSKKNVIEQKCSESLVIGNVYIDLMSIVNKSLHSVGKLNRAKILRP